MAKLILYQAKSPYPGDITKNCALTGKEVDNNFLNLKGEDIKTIYLDEETKKLTFVRFKDGLKNCNGETIESRMEIDLTELEYVTGYKYEDGVIKITYSNGKTAVMPIEAFGMAVATDSTISGNGSRSNPLSISQAMRTGQYQPVLDFIDMTEGENLPKDAVDGDGYVTREVKSDFGMFYNADQALLLDGILKMENSEWRVPSKKDWDKLLNYLEDCDKYKNHSLRSETDLDARGMILGNLAGWKSKSTGEDYWDGGELSNAGFLRVYPTGSFSALTGAYSGFGNHAHFWTVTEGDMSCRNFYSKKFVDLKGTVTQIEAMPDMKLTIRLVKDFIGDNYHKFEDIHGRVYETKLVASESEECNQVWTMVNVDISDVEHDLVPTPIPESATSAITKEYAYYINRWDGRKWDKHEMVEGDCVVLLSKDKAYDDESRVDEYRLERDLEGNLYLKNMDEFWQNQIDELSSAITEIREQVEELSGATDDLREIVGDGLSGITLTDAIIDLRDDLEAEISARTEADEELWEALSAETQAREEGDEKLHDMITAETQAREEADEELHDMITAETQAREEADQELWDALNETADTLYNMITAETQAREEADDELWDALSAETQARIEKDDELQQEIDDEVSARTEADQEIKDSIGLPSDLPLKAAVEYTDDDFKNGDITVFGFINASNDYGYNLEG